MEHVVLTDTLFHCHELMCQLVISDEKQKCLSKHNAVMFIFRSNAASKLCFTITLTVSYGKIVVNYVMGWLCICTAFSYSLKNLSAAALCLKSLLGLRLTFYILICLAANSLCAKIFSYQTGSLGFKSR